MRPVARLLPFLLLAGVSTAAWAAWLGWDQHRDVHPDGSTTGPYEAWQVIGLVVTLLVPVCWAASRRHVLGTVLGPTVGLTLAAYDDWSDDSSGLFIIGVGLVMIGSFATTAIICAVAGSVRQRRPRTGF
ncbi:hypothetical protein FB563_6537 [Streptomyces puniciscabiei]|uniref:SPW repeat-containing protein n=2 Tax=Streptomyces puniciscabiei TaxID=164348 RepID=A0A542TI60_9ACTN|nr:hypothetical protein FB563_6537 [Streptomyces puniciscabiei]